MKDKVISGLFVTILFLFSLSYFFIEEQDISFSERRRLMTKEDLFSDFFANLNDYMSDQFWFRDSFILANSFFDRYVLGKFDNNDVYLQNGYIFEKNYPLDEKSVDQFIEKLNFIYRTYLMDSQVFSVLIPDKAYFLDDFYLKIDYSYLFNKVQSNLLFDSIDVLSSISLEDFYKTDIHIIQKCYLNIVNYLGKHLGFSSSSSLKELMLTDAFYGATYMKAPFIKPDEISILSNNVIENALVHHLEYGDKPVYELDKLSSSDLYSVYLGGPSAYLEIINPSSFNSSELVIFRDSFASSLSPLLIESYKKIILIDLRYISMDVVSSLVDFKDKDVLFFYSTLIANQSHLLKVNVK